MVKFQKASAKKTCRSCIRLFPSGFLARARRKLIQESRSQRGFTLIELVVVISIILILISIAAPIYRNSIISSKEAVLRDNLFTMRSLIDQYTLDKQEAPQDLENLVSEGYIRQLPNDPFTASNSTWEPVFEDTVLMSPDQLSPGLVDVHSGSSLNSLSGEPYSSW